MAVVQFESNTVDQHRDGASAGLQSRSSGIVKALKCKANQNANVDKTIRGSGFLSSSTRFTTALHLVNSELHNEASGLPVKVRFGSSGDGLNINNYVTDSGVDHDPLQHDETYRYDVEEDPYLPMRLFQLGLNAWAWKDASANSPEWRKELRKWEFKVATGDANHNDGTFYDQGFATVVNTNIQGEDIAVLEVIGLEERCPQVGACETAVKEIWDDLQAGKFPLNRPGVFFDHMKPILYESLTNDKPVWLEHMNQWPVDSHDLVRLISRPGYPISGAQNMLTSLNSCTGEQHDLTGVVAHTLDSKKGSSGGAILSNYNELDEEGYPLPESKLAVFGIHTASKVDTDLFTQGGDWLEVGPASAEEPNPVWDGENANFFTGISNPTLLREDPNPVVTSPGDPEACEPGETYGCIPCKDYNGQDECIEFMYSEPEIIGSITVPVIPIDVPEDDPSSREERYGARRVNCTFNAAGEPYSHWDWHFKRKIYPGMIVGLMGASVGPFNFEDSVGDLLAICAPLSSKSYTENWHFLHVKGSVLPPFLTNLRGRRDWGPLNSMITDSYTINDDSPTLGHEIRPTPMKFCPPTYIMKSVKVRLNGLGIEGIFELGCKRSANPNAPEVGTNGGEEIVVGLSAEAELGADEYEMFGDTYTLDQRIGNPNASETGDNLTDQVCDGFVSGLTMIHDKNGSLLHLSIVCTPYQL